MGQTMRYEVKRDVLLWAIHESQKIMIDIEEKFPKINEWIEGDLTPTMKQKEEKETDRILIRIIMAVYILP